MAQVLAVVSQTLTVPSLEPETKRGLSLALTKCKRFPTQGTDPFRMPQKWFPHWFTRGSIP